MIKKIHTFHLFAERFKFFNNQQTLFAGINLVVICCLITATSLKKTYLSKVHGLKIRVNDDKKIHTFQLFAEIQVF